MVKAPTKPADLGSIFDEIVVNPIFEDGTTKGAKAVPVETKRIKTLAFLAEQRIHAQKLIGEIQDTKDADGKTVDGAQVELAKLVHDEKSAVPAGKFAAEHLSEPGKSVSAWKLATVGDKQLEIITLKHGIRRLRAPWPRGPVSTDKVVRKMLPHGERLVTKDADGKITNEPAEAQFGAPRGPAMVALIDKLVAAVNAGQFDQSIYDAYEKSPGSAPGGRKKK